MSQSHAYELPLTSFYHISVSYSGEEMETRVSLTYVDRWKHKSSYIKDLGRHLFGDIHTEG